MKEPLEILLNKLPAYIEKDGERLFLYIYKNDANKWRTGYGKWGKFLIHPSLYKKDSLDESVEECLEWLEELKKDGIKSLN